MISVHGTNINVIVKGQGEHAVLLLHGWGQNQYMMKFIQDHLCTKYTVVNLDLPGFGESDEPPQVWTIQDYVSCIHELLDALQIVNPIIIAHSFGARIALRYALCYHIDHMILTGAAGIRKPRNLAYIVRVYGYKILKRCHLAPQMGSDDFRNASSIMQGVLVASVNDDIRADLSKIASDTLLIWGEQDCATPLWMGQTMEQEMPHAALVVMEKGDHFAYFHQSQQFLRIIDAYLEAIL